MLYLQPTAQRTCNWTCYVGIVTATIEDSCEYHGWCVKLTGKADILQEKWKYISCNTTIFPSRNLKYTTIPQRTKQLKFAQQ